MSLNSLRQSLSARSLPRWSMNRDNSSGSIDMSVYSDSLSPQATVNLKISSIRNKKKFHVNLLNILKSREEYKMMVVPVNVLLAKSSFASITKDDLVRFQVDMRVAFICHLNHFSDSITENNKFNCFGCFNHKNEAPQSNQKLKFQILCNNIKKFKVDYIWIDICCLDTENENNTTNGINSYFCYMSRCSHFIITLPISLKAINIKSPLDVDIIQNRAWIRLEVFIFHSIQLARNKTDIRLYLMTNDNVMNLSQIKLTKNLLPSKGLVSDPQDMVYINKLENEMMNLYNIMTLESRVESCTLNCDSTLNLDDKMLLPGCMVALFHLLNRSPWRIVNINLSRNGFGNRGAIQLAKYLKTDRTIESLILGYNAIDCDGIIAIAKSLEMNEALQLLNLRNNKIDDNGMIALCDALQKNSTLQELVLFENDIRDSSCLALSKALKANQSLKRLNLVSSHITDVGLCALAESLKTCGLQELNLSLNEIGDSGCGALCEALKSNTCLKELNLYDNNISDDGGQLIAKMLSENKTLENLNLSFNKIADRGALAIAQVILDGNSCLKYLSLKSPFFISKSLKEEIKTEIKDITIVL